MCNCSLCSQLASLLLRMASLASSAWRRFIASFFSQACTADGKYCGPSSLVGVVCAPDMPKASCLAARTNYSAQFAQKLGVVGWSEGAAAESPSGTAPLHAVLQFKRPWLPAQHPSSCSPHIDTTFRLLQMKGCEAWVALCASNATKVAQCTQPGPVPKLLSTMIVREAINSLCSTHYMDGCYECEPQGVVDLLYDISHVLPAACNLQLAWTRDANGRVNPPACTS